MSTVPQTKNSSQETTESESPIVFFDGVCGLCNRTVNFLIGIDRKKRLRYAPLQGETAAERLPEDLRKDLNSMILFDKRGICRKSTAVARTLMHVGGMWGVLGFLVWVIPAPLRNFGYGVVAANRYRIWGKLEACRLPRPGEQELFLP